MNFPKLILLSTLVVFGVIAGVGIIKKVSNRPVAVEKPAALAPKKVKEVKKETPKPQKVAEKVKNTPVKTTESMPNIDRIFQLFTIGPNQLPIVETLTYSSSVAWLKGRPAWIADYASYYATSRHFIARSLNGSPDYLSQKVSQGSRFNVFRKDKNIEFHLVVDLSACKMGFYYLDKGTGERVLLKTYKVGIGRPDPQKVSGYLTPLGTYSLGSKIAIYKPGVTGLFQDKTIEMIRIFGTRWLPFDQEVEGCSEPAKGFGLHGAPWVEAPGGAQLIEQIESLGAYESDGCVRLSNEDIEELFAIVITKPTFVHLVRNFNEAHLPGTEVAAPTK